MVIVQVYMPTTEHKDEETDAMYDRIEELLDKDTKGKDYTLVTGDWNVVVGEGKEDKFIGHYAEMTEEKSWWSFVSEDRCMW